MTRRKWLLPKLLAIPGLLCLVAWAEEESHLEAKALESARTPAAQVARAH